jgi:hypothetical protein
MVYWSYPAIPTLKPRYRQVSTALAIIHATLIGNEIFELILAVSRYRFSVDIFDADKKLIGNIDKLETDNEGRISMTSRLPWTFEITSGKADENFVGMCYSDQCWQCDDSDGGGHSWSVTG